MAFDHWLSQTSRQRESACRDSDRSVGKRKLSRIGTTEQRHVLKVCIVMD